jgi:hypothetical protein
MSLLSIFLMDEPFQIEPIRRLPQIKRPRHRCLLELRNQQKHQTTDP